MRLAGRRTLVLVEVTEGKILEGDLTRGDDKQLSAVGWQVGEEASSLNGHLGESIWRLAWPQPE